MVSLLVFHAWHERVPRESGSRPVVSPRITHRTFGACRRAGCRAIGAEGGHVQVVRRDDAVQFIFRETHDVDAHDHLVVAANCLFSASSTRPAAAGWPW